MANHRSKHDGTPETYEQEAELLVTEFREQGLIPIPIEDRIAGLLEDGRPIRALRLVVTRRRES